MFLHSMCNYELHIHAQLCPTLCNSLNCSPPGSSVPRILQARVLEWGAISSSEGSSPPRDHMLLSCLSCIGSRFSTSSATCTGFSFFGFKTRKLRTLFRACWVTQWCPTLRAPMDWSPAGSAVHGILQARKLEWVAISSFRGSSQPRDQTRVSDIYLHWQASSLPLRPPAKPTDFVM